MKVASEPPNLLILPHILSFAFNMFLQAISILSALAATASAHGYVETVTAGGVVYTGMLVSTTETSLNSSINISI